MGDDLLEKVEAKLRTSLSFDDSLRSKNKVNIPFTIMSLEGNSQLQGKAVHLFSVPMELTEGEKKAEAETSSEKPKFGVVTVNGTVLVYDTMFRRMMWKQHTNTKKVSWGALTKKGEASKILILSRLKGMFVIPQVAGTSSTAQESPFAKPPEPDALWHDIHIGFCKPVVCSDKDVLLPVGMEKLGLMKSSALQIVIDIYKFPSTLMAFKEVGSKLPIKHVICTTEDGAVHLIQIKPDCGPDEGELLSTTVLPTYKDLEQQPIGICIEGCDDTYVVGTSTKYIFLIKWDQTNNTLQPSGKKILPSDGVSCMAMREGKQWLAAGCFDGTVRLFGFPDMNQISYIQYHVSEINSLLFVNENLEKTGRWFLLCSSTRETFISVWNIQSMLEEK